MKRHYVLKFLSIVLYYGWLGLLYGMVFSLLLQDKGLSALWLKNVVTMLTVALTLWFAYRFEMRYHMPTPKYVVIVLIALLGFLGCVQYPLASPLCFTFFLASIAYKCPNCVAFTRINRE